MSSKSWSRVKSLFFAASDRDASDRSRFLAEQTSVDSDLRAQVKEMLADHDEAGTFLNSPLNPSQPENEETEVLEAIATQLAAGDVLCGRYRIRRYVARGGMGEVYEADDQEMEIVVAIKVLRPEVFGSAGQLARFKREIDLARRVSHPNIGRIHDFGHHTLPDGRNLPFLTMEFLEGETLAERISRAGPIPEAEALPLIRGFVRALDAIHQNGIVHRDFKSSNVMLVTQPNRRLGAKVMDFGLARPTKVGEHTLTRTGFVSGTPAYMAPEQFEGISTPAGDVYAIGVVVHEMLTGFRPNVKSGVGVNILSPEFEPIVRRCLSVKPSDRFQNAGEVLDLLAVSTISHSQLKATRPHLRPWVWICATVFVLAGIVSYAIFRPDTHGLDSVNIPKHLALLPIESQSADPLDSAFAAGFSDTIRGDLAEMEAASKNSLWVIPSAEVRGIKTASQALREVGANLVLAATLHRTATGVSLTAELVDPKNLHLLKSATIFAANLSALRGATVKRIAALLDVPVTNAIAQEVAESGTAAPGAFEFYEQGLGYLQNHNPTGLDNAIALFKKALGVDSAFALAYAGLGEAYASKYEMTKDPQWVDQAVLNGKKAIGLNGRLAQVHSIMGVTYRLTGHPELALSELKKAVEIEPDCMLCLHHLGDAYLDLGQLESAERSYQTMVRNQHGNVSGYSGLGKVAAVRGDLHKAAEMYKEALDLAPDRAAAAANLGGIYIEMERYEEAVPLLQKALKMQPFDQTSSNLGAAFMFLGRYREAVDAMEQSVKLAPDNHDNWRNLGDSYRLVPELRSKAGGAYRTALEYAQKALKVKPGDSDLLISIGLYHAHLGDSREALLYVNQAVRKAPGDGSVLFNAALSMELIGRRKDALNYLAQSAKAGYPISLIEKEPELSALHTDPAYERWVATVRSAISAH